MAARRWEVRWCSSVPEDENGDTNIDAAEYASRYFDTEAAAREFAKEVAGESPWSVAELCAFEPTSRAAIEDPDNDIDWWVEDGRLLAYVGKREEIESA